jgi:hypothetical protein
MSYCRWTNSDIFLSTEDAEYITCVQCQLGNNEDGPCNKYFLTKESALKHVKQHLAFGDYIPEDVIQRLEEEVFENIIMEKYEHPRRFARVL